MKRAEFVEHIVRRRIELIEKTLASKADEYAIDGSFDYNFQTAARINNQTPEKALWDMATKHLVSIMDLVHGGKQPTQQLIDDKIGDMINYLILLEGILNENIKEQKVFETINDKQTL